jgi:hypothetical protein
MPVEDLLGALVPTQVEVERWTAAPVGAREVSHGTRADASRRDHMSAVRSVNEPAW